MKSRRQLILIYWDLIWSWSFCVFRLDRFIKARKNKNKLLENSNVVYKLPCTDCDATYVEQTKRQLITRIKEHKSNLRLDSSKHSVVSEYIVRYNHLFDWDKAEILDIEHKYQKRLVSEMIHIKQQENGINSHIDCELLNTTYTDIWTS